MVEAHPPWPGAGFPAVSPLTCSSPLPWQPSAEAATRARQGHSCRQRLLQLDPTLLNFVIPRPTTLLSAPLSARCIPSIHPVSIAQRILRILDSISAALSATPIQPRHVGHPPDRPTSASFYRPFGPASTPASPPARPLSCHAARLNRPTPLVRGRVVAAWALAAIDRIHKWPLL